MTDESTEKTYYGMTDDELLACPTVYRDDLFKDKVVLVSGGGTGIGKGIAALFGRLGASVVICSRKEENLRSTEALLEKIGAPCDIHAMTIRDPEQVEKLMSDVWEKHGRLDILVNNAGGQFPQDAIDYSTKGWHAVIETNLTGTFYMMQAAARQWRDNGQAGSIVNILAAFYRGMPQIAHTSAARAAVSNLALSLGVEWAPHKVRVNCVAPGTIETVGLNVYPPEARATFTNRNPMRRLGTVMEVAEAVAYLGGPSGTYITGETLTVDGGQYMWGHAWPFSEPEYFRAVKP
ncbi:MAG: SDR family oxidoreductase [Candidatus Hydrogenedentes bacterium]|nr:SDR family oxidoreductase [Candidatus Hydrogenedentota bacterium]